MTDLVKILVGIRINKWNIKTYDKFENDKEVKNYKVYIE